MGIGYGNDINETSFVLVKVFLLHGNDSNETSLVVKSITIAFPFFPEYKCVVSLLGFSNYQNYDSEFL